MPIVTITSIGSVALPELLIYILIAIIGKDGLVKAIQKIYSKVKKTTSKLTGRFGDFVNKVVDNPKAMEFLENYIDELEEKLAQALEDETYE